MSPTGRYTTAVPLVFIMVVSAIKEIFEDFKRHVEDRAVNRSKVKALRKATEDGPSQWVDIMWNEVVVGDFLKITSGQFFPADMVREVTPSDDCRAPVSSVAPSEDFPRCAAGSSL